MTKECIDTIRARMKRDDGAIYHHDMDKAQRRKTK